MTRKKVKLAYITNESARKATFKKRKKGVLKKVSELSTLCDVDACVIMYSPYNAQPEVWPASPDQARLVLSKFKRMPEMEQSKKMVNQEGFLKQRLAKVKEQLKKQHKDNREKEITCLMYRALALSSSSSNADAKGGGDSLLQGLSMVDLHDLGWIIDRHLKDIDARVDQLREKMMPGTAMGGMGVQKTPVQLPEAFEEEEKKVVGLGAAGSSSSSSFSNNSWAMEAAMLQNPWLMNLLSANDLTGFCGEDMMNTMLPSFEEDLHPQDGIWSSFFP